MLRILLAALFSMSMSLATLAQDQSRAILVLDASGSMWGQIDGVAKITIAQNVVGDLLTTLPDSQLLGLMAYGHRRKGDCSDIELLLAPTPSREEIAARVNDLTPRGKTPMTDAVIAAAEALRYTEEKATVILISDGIETCNPNVCEAARTLEQTGVDFTAHVIGFDVSNPEAIAQMQCLAEETGGSFRTASTAEELSEALQAVAEPEPAPEPVQVTFRAIEGEDGPVINSDLVWTMGTDAAGVLFENEMAGQLSAEMMPGSGRVEVLRTTDEASAEAMFTVNDENMTVTLVLPVFLPPASLEAPESAVAGSLVPVRWTGPNADGDYISSADIDMRDGQYHHYAYTRDSDDSTLMLRMPPNPGSVEIRYMLNDGTKVLARRLIEVTPLDIGFDVPDTAIAGSTIPVGWTGPDYDGDYLTIAAPGQTDGQYVNYSYTRDGTPLALLMPPEPGKYEIRYVLNASGTVAGRTSIEVIEVLASLDTVDTAPAGSTIKVTWDGPDYQGDYISIAEIGSRAGTYQTYANTRDASPAVIQLPLQPGEYEVRYIQRQDSTILARRTITVTEVTADLIAPATAPANARISVSWQGPDYRNDHITVAAIGSRPAQYEAYTYTRDGSPLTLQMPTEPGEYELRYVAQSNDRRILARVPIVIEAVSATLEAPDMVDAGAKLQVMWTGPGGSKDHITIAQPGMRPSQYEAYTYTRDGSPLRLQMPTKPGEYELRYIQQGTDRSVLVSQPITVEAVSATLEADANVPAGASLIVTWDGPGNARDHVTIAAPDDAAGKYQAFTYTREGNPLRVQVPSAPGTYELRYIAQGTDRAIIARQTLVVDPVSATLEAAETIAAGGNLVVTWSGPDYRNDYITISKAGDDGYEVLTYTRDGSPLIIKAPDAPGAYELRYVISKDRVVIARQNLTVE